MPFQKETLDEKVFLFKISKEQRKYKEQRLDI